MKKAVFGFIALAVLGIGTAIGFAQINKAEKGDSGYGLPGFGRKGGRFGIGFPLRSLGLTEEQQAKVREIVMASKERLRPQMDSLRANRENLEKVTAGGSFDEKTISDIANQSGQIIAEMIVERERAKSQIYAILTDEQRAKLAEMKKQREENRKSFFRRLSVGSGQ